MPSFTINVDTTSTAPSTDKFSYAAAAKCLQTSTRVVSERLAVAEELLGRPHLTPSPDALVLQHVTYALTCNKHDFDAYRARYWRLLARLLQRGNPVAPALPAAALRVLLGDPEAPLLDACAAAMCAMCDSDAALPGDLELLAKLSGAAITHGLTRTALVLLLSFDDAVRLSGSARTFAAALHVLWPVCAASGRLRDAGAIAARNALFATPTAVLNDDSYFESLYHMLADTRKLSQRHLLLLPECTALLMRACRQSAHGRGQHFVTPRKRPFEVIDASPPPPAASSKVGDTNKNSLPIEYAVPLRFLRNSLHALTRNVGNDDVHWVRAVSRLLDTATELRVFRLEYDQALVKQDAESRTKKMAAKKPILERPSVRELLERVVESAAKALPHAAPEDVPHWADCGRAVVTIAEDIIEDHLRLLLKAVLQCSQKHASRVDVRNSLAQVLHALIKVYQSTRKMPTLFQMLVDLRQELDGAISLLAAPHLQKAFVACARSLPRGQAAKCVGVCLEGGMSEAMCFILSLFIESIDFDELCTVLPLIAEMLNGADVNRPPVLHLYSSVVVACARYSLPTTHEVVEKLDFALVEKKTRMKKQCESMAAQVARLSFLAAWTLLQIGEPGESVSVSACLSGYAFLECMAGLPLDSVEEDESGWKRLVAGDTGNWTRPVLKAVAAMTPVVDSVEQGLAQIDANADEGVRTMVRWAVLHVRCDDGFWDGLLEMRFAKRVLGSVLLDEIGRSLSDSQIDCEHILRITPKLRGTLLDESQRTALLRGCQRIRGSAAAPTEHLRALLQAAEETLQCHDVDLADEVKESDIDSQLVDELKQVVARETTRISRRRKRDVVDDGVEEEEEEEAKRDDKMYLKLLHRLQQMKNVERTVTRHRPVLSSTAVVIGDIVLFGDASRREVALQVLCVLAIDDANAGVEGLFDLLLRRITAKKASVQWLERLCGLTCALTCGRMGMVDVCDWTPSGIVAAVLQAARLKPPAAPTLRSITLLRHCVIAVAGALWRCRQSCRREEVDLSSVRGRALAFEAVEVRRQQAASLWRAALFPLASCALAANGSMASEWCELVVSAIAQLLAADVGNDRDDDRARMHYAALRAVSLLSKRSTLVFAALRCIRTSLRSGCCNEDAARVVARFYQRVNGPPTVAALVDLAVALVSVGDANVRAAIEHGSAALISRLDERGLNEALRACDDDSRGVLRALVESYRSDFEYERR